MSGIKIVLLVLLVLIVLKTLTTNNYYIKQKKPGISTRFFRFA